MSNSTPAKVGKMRAHLQVMGFVYGCVATVVALGVHIGELLGWEAVDRISVVALAIHWLVLGLSVQPMTGPWTPVLRVTVTRLRTARALMAILAGQVCLFVLLVIVREPVTPAWVLGAFVTSIFVLTSAYLACHWGLRPENIFGRRLLSLANPIGSLTAAVRKRYRSRLRANRRARD